MSLLQNAGQNVSGQTGGQNPLTALSSILGPSQQASAQPQAQSSGGFGTPQSAVPQTMSPFFAPAGGLLNNLGQPQVNNLASLPAASSSYAPQNGLNYGGVASSLNNSAGAAASNISQLYGNTLGRAPEPGAISYYTNAANNGYDIASLIGQSPEAIAKGSTGPAQAGMFAPISTPNMSGIPTGINVLRGTGTQQYQTGAPTPTSTAPPATAQTPSPAATQTPTPTAAPAPAPSPYAALTNNPFASELGWTPSTLQQLQQTGTYNPSAAAPATTNPTPTTTPAPSSSASSQYSALANNPFASELGWTPSALSQLAQTGTYSAPSPAAQTPSPTPTAAPSPAASSGVSQSQIVSDYAQYLGRTPSQDEINFYLNAANNGMTTAQMAQYLQASPEYKAKQ